MTYSERLYIMENKQKIKEQEEQKRLKEIAKIERKKEQEKEQKQYEKDLKIACYHDLKDSFNKVFEKHLATYPEFNEDGKIVLQMQLARFYEVSIRNEYIKTFGKTLVEQDYIDSIYDKTLQEVYKKWVKHFEAKQIEEAQRKIKQQEEINNSTAFKIIMGLIFAGVVIWLLIKFALVIGIALAIIVFLVILGCAMK